ncbi:hypothetical protein FSP39_018022 [Pinctada imbricata]|uniref:Uncharacterized protein n=1 Tax=Pinctada imbricata TaxID=66713 RepID=A0AA88XT16_PINIB|nr:hypothetical protein FSP39_018022 [Pinctada imbricata]
MHSEVEHVLSSDEKPGTSTTKIHEELPEREDDLADTVLIDTPEENFAGGNCVLQILTSAYEEEEDNYTFLCHVNNACNETCCGWVLLATSFLLSVFAVVIGILRSHDCPCNRAIPVYLAVEGVVLFIKSSMQAARVICKLEPDPGERHCVFTIIDISTLFLIFWNFTGGVWVLGVFDQVQTSIHDAPTYCDILMYWFSVTMVLLTTLVLIFKVFFYFGLWILYDKMEASGTCLGALREEKADHV